MPKKNLLISAALTAFVLVMVTGVASAYKQVTANFVQAQATPTTEPVAVVAPTEIVPTEIVPIILTHQEAALVAANYLEQTDLFSVEIAPWNDIDAYKVVFSTGDIVYVSIDGQILEAEAPQTIVITESVSNNGNSGKNNNQSAPKHDDDDHDDDHDDDDDD